MWGDIAWLFGKIWEYLRGKIRTELDKPTETKPPDHDLISRYEDAIDKLTTRYEGVITAMEVRNTTYLGNMELRHAATIATLTAKVAELEVKEKECDDKLRKASRRVDSQDVKLKELEGRLAESERAYALVHDKGYQDRSMQHTKLLMDETKGEELKEG